ncbi:hypothetical protein V6N13_005913 [Hibiscus sabdariffa]
MASARWESMDSATDLDLCRLEEETLYKELLRLDSKRRALATLAPTRLNNPLAGKNLELLNLSSLNMKTPTTTTLFLSPDLVLPLPTVGLSSMSEPGGTKKKRALVYEQGMRGAAGQVLFMNFVNSQTLKRRTNKAKYTIFH